MNGNSLDGVREQVGEVSAYAAANGRRVRFALNGFALVRDTEEEAVAAVEEIISNADAEKVRDFGEAVRQAGQSARDRKGMWQNSEFRDLVQYNDGFRTGLIGTPEQVARRIVDYKLAGVDLLLLAFLHVREDVEDSAPGSSRWSAGTRPRSLPARPVSKPDSKPEAGDAGDAGGTV